MTRNGLMAAWAVVGLVTAWAAGADKAPAHKTDWMFEGKWGVMYHFSSGQRAGQIKTREDWDKVVREFDVKGLARQLSELGAGYFVITTYHYGLGVAPNSTVDDGKFPSRDLIMDLADELGKHNISLMLYYPTGMGIDADSAQKAANVIGELSKRYGKKVKGWWMDNSMPGETEKQKLIADAARSGNPDALVAMSKGESPFDDYLSGNDAAPGTAVCRGRFMGDRQWHVLTFLGYNWGGNCKQQGQPRYDAGKAAGITGKLVSNGGVITWDVPWEMNGLLAKECMPVLGAIAKAAREAKREGPAALGIKPPKGGVPAGPHKTDWLHDARWGVFYMYSPDARDEAAWEAAMAKFEVPTLVAALKDVQAGYFMMAARAETAAYAAAPISTVKDGKFPRRDLVGEIAEALAKEKIPLMVYYSARDAGAAEAIKELSLRYGKKVSGWYIDHAKDFAALAEAARAGNPETLLGLCPGYWGGGTTETAAHLRFSPFDDYTQGRTRWPASTSCPKRFVDGMQWHTLGTFGFNKYQSKFDAPRAAEITAKNVAAGGVMTWMTPHLPTGAIEPGWVVEAARAAGKSARELTRNEPVDDPVEAQIKNPTPPAPPEGAVATTCVQTTARCISGKQDWWPERQEQLGLLVGVGKRHMHFVRSQLAFDLEKVDKSKPVVLAVLHLYTEGAPSGEPTEQCNHVEFNRWIKKIEERDQKWYNAHYAAEGGKTWKFTKPGAIEVDVTEMVKAWVNGGQPNYGFRLSNPGLGAEWQRYGMVWRNFESKPYDASTNPKGPRLVVYQK